MLEHEPKKIANIKLDASIDPYDKTWDLDKSILIKLDTTIVVVTGHLGFGLKRQNIFLMYGKVDNFEFIYFVS